MRRSRFAVAFCAPIGVLALPLAAPLAAQPEHPNHRRGLDTPTAYRYEQVDAINLFNGNLNVTIPIAEIHVGGSLIVPVGLHYNSMIWGFETGPPASDPPHELTLSAKVDPFPNAGVGWLVTLGKLYPPFTPPYNDGASRLLIEPDGTRRFFSPQLHPGHPTNPDPNVFYTTDGSYLRLKLMGARWDLESPNGLVREFRASDGNLLKVRDRSGNELNVDYTTSNRWTLSDNALPTPRTHTIDFHAASGTVPQRVSRISLAGFAGTSTIYDFIYDVIWIPRHYNHTSHGAPGGLPAQVNVALLSQISLPAGAGSYSMQYYLDNGTSPDFTNPSGVLRRLDLPTLGRFEWDYYRWEIATGGAPFPETWHHGSDGVRTKHIYSASGDLEGQWTYLALLGGARPDGSFPADPTREKQTRVTDPLGNVTSHYFTSYPDSWLHGLPVTDQISDGTRYLSRQSFQGAVSLTNLKRAEWNRFVSDHLNANSNQRLDASRTVFHDDIVDGVARWSGVDYADFNGLGRYRTATTSGNFDSGNARTSHVAYTRDGPPDAHDSGTYPGDFSMWPPGLPWVIDTFEEQWDSEGDATAKKTFDVDPATGRVRRARIHKASDGAVSSADVIVVNDYDARGNLAFERFYGGDTQTVGIGSDLETLALPATPTYHLAHTTLWGTRATSAYVSSDPTVLSFKTLDCGDDPATGGFDPGVDASTGLPSKCRDTSRIATSYEYDTLGRLVWEKPESGQDGWTEYVYTTASSLEPARVNVKRWPNGGGAQGTNPLAESSVVYDDFGRVFEERQKIANGTWSARQTLYNAMGWRTSVSEQGNTAKTTQLLDYDAFGRPAKIRPPDDNASHDHDVTFTYAGIREVSRSFKVATAVGSEVATSVTSLNDRQGRLYRVREEADLVAGEPKNTTTTYGYDVGNRLTSVSHLNFLETQTQARSFSYDQRGFLLSETHPEKGATGNGTVFYSSYDARGHVGRKQDGPFDTTFVYDAAERLKLVRESGSGFVNCTNNGGRRCLKSFTYGTSNAATQRTNGRLEHASRFNHVGAGYNLTLEVIETYTYAGKQGRVSRRNTAFNIGGSPGTESWRQTFTYDALGNVEDLGYPDCTWTDCPSSPRTVEYERTNGWLTSIPSFANTITNATTISYHPNGLYHEIAHGNGVIDKQLNDPNSMRRPRELSARASGSDLWRSGTYAYDGAGNVKSMGGSYFLYDRVSRIVDGHVYDGPTGGGLLRYQTYAYDPFGNLRSIGGDPWAPGRATPTSVATNRLSGSTHDAAGNMTGWNGSACADPLPSTPCYEYDAFGMVTRYSTGNPGKDWRYTYTADDERFWSVGAPGITGGSIWTLRDLDGKVLREHKPNSEAAWSRFRDYVYRDGQLLASAGKTVTPYFSDVPATHRAAAEIEAIRVAGITGGCQGPPNPAYCPSFNVQRQEMAKFIIVASSPPGYEPPACVPAAAHFTDVPCTHPLAKWIYELYRRGITGGCSATLFCPQAKVTKGQMSVFILKAQGITPPACTPLFTDYTCSVPPYFYAAWADEVYRRGIDVGCGSTTFCPEQLLTRADMAVWLARGFRLPFPDDYPKHYHLDHLGTPRLITSNAASSRLAYHAYFPFGEELTSTSQDLEQKKFTGHERDLGNPASVADDLDYMHARFYNPQVGRFLGTDKANDWTLGSPQSWNRYTYGRNNPLKYIDPDGNAVRIPAEHFEGNRVLRGAIQTAILNNPAISERHLAAFVVDALVADYLPTTREEWHQARENQVMTFGTFGLGLPAGEAKAIASTSFSAFKRLFGAAGAGRHWHHVVEQTPGNIAKFGQKTLQNRSNMVSLERSMHEKISAYYSSKQPFTGGLTVREWLSTQSLEAQREFGLGIFKQFAHQ